MGAGARGDLASAENLAWSGAKGRNTLVSFSSHLPISQQCLSLAKLSLKPAGKESWTLQFPGILGRGGEGLEKDLICR